MAKRKYTPFVMDQHGNKYVDAASIMSPLIPFIDGLTISTFKGDKRTYLKLAEAIAWVREEMKHHSADEYAKVLVALQRFEREDGSATNT